MSIHPTDRPDHLLRPEHQKLIDDSAISQDVAETRGYRTVETIVELRRLGFSDTQCRAPALLIPIYDVNGELALYQIRPDEPRIVNGKAVKYETPRGAKMTLDVPPSIRAHLGDPNVPLYVTEGARKADSAVSNGLCCIALLGVWNYRGTNEHGGKLALADWESIAVNDRAVYIVFDSDVMQKKPVCLALSRLKAFLETRKARVKVVYLPPGAAGAKVGLDDFFAAGGSEKQLLKLATGTLREPPGDQISTLDITDIKNARRLIKTYGEDLRYCYPFRKYLVWDGIRWHMDEQGKVLSDN